MSVRFENLDQLLGCYFHQDFVIDYGSPGNAMAEMLRNAPVEQRRRGADEIDQILDLKPEESQLRRILDGFGCAYAFDNDGFNASSWLRHVQAQLRESIGGEQHGTSGV